MGVADLKIRNGLPLRLLAPCALVLLAPSLVCAQNSRSALGVFDPRANSEIKNNQHQLGLILPVATSLSTTMGNIGNYNTIQPTARFARRTTNATGEEEILYDENQGGYFSQPAWTLLEGETSLALSYIHLDFDKMNGEDLDDVLDRFSDYGPDGLGVVGTGDSDFSLEADVFLLSAARGITDDLEFSFILPLIDLRGSGGFTTTFDIPNEPGIFLQETTSARFNESDFDLGDLTLRTKYSIFAEADHAFAVGADLVLPTGDEDQFLGGGGVGYRIRSLYAKRCGNWYPTVELGYYWTNLESDSRLPFDEDDYNLIEYRVGAPYRLSDTVTVGVELIGFESEAFDQNDIGFFGRWDMSHRLDGLVFNLGLRIPLDDDGLRPAVAPAFSVQYAY